MLAAAAGAVWPSGRCAVCAGLDRRPARVLSAHGRCRPWWTAGPTGPRWSPGRPASAVLGAAAELAGLAVVRAASARRSPPWRAPACGGSRPARRWPPSCAAVPPPATHWPPRPRSGATRTSPRRPAARPPTRGRAGRARRAGCGRSPTSPPRGGWSKTSGGGLAAAVARLAAAARADEEQVRRELAAQLAGPRATAALLARLPLAGVAIGAALGADPVGFLLGGRPGRPCLLAGVTAGRPPAWPWTDASLAGPSPRRDRDLAAVLLAGADRPAVPARPGRRRSRRLGPAGAAVPGRRCVRPRRRWSRLPAGAICHGSRAVVGVAAALAVPRRRTPLWCWSRPPRLGRPPARQRRPAGRRRAVGAADLPRAADLLASCLESGAAPRRCPRRGRRRGRRSGRDSGCRAGAVLVRAGGDLTVTLAGARRGPARGWSRSVARAAATGAPLADTVRGLADDERERARWAAPSGPGVPACRRWVRSRPASCRPSCWSGWSRWWSASPARADGLA